MNAIIMRWCAVCLMPIGLATWFALNPATDAADHLINGIIMACAAVFLFKMALFAMIAGSLRQDARAKKHGLWQMLPPLLFGIYVAYYFLR